MWHPRIWLLLLVCLGCGEASAKPKPTKKKPAGDAITLTVLPFGTPAGGGLFLDVGDAGGEYHSGRTSGTDWAGNTKVTNTMRRDKSLDIVVRNRSSTAQPATVEWFFVSTAADGGQKQIFDRGSKEFQLAPSTSVNHPVTSKELQSVQISRNSEAHAKGRKINGWIVRLLDQEDQVVAQKCSDAVIEAITHDATKLQKLHSSRGLSD
jgi:hypothetical protein